MTKTDQIKELKKEIRKLKKLVLYDPLTGLLNRRGFLEQAGTVYKTLYAKRRNTERRPVHDEIPFSVMFIDVDNFKILNDTFGHDLGDEVLKSVSQVIKKTVRTNDLVGRLGGEEFVITLAGADQQTAERVAERIRRNIERMTVPNRDQKVCVTASLGVAMRTEEVKLTALIHAADQAMYQAKQQGKNRVMVCSIDSFPLTA